MNKITLIGRLADVKGRVSKSGINSVVFQVVVEESYKDASGEYKKIISNFFPVLFGKRAEGINEAIRQGKPPFKKGHLVMIEATVRSNSYTDNGQTKYGYDFIVDRIELLVRTLDEMLESRLRHQQSSHAGHVPDVDYEVVSEAPTQIPAPKSRVLDDDIPFA